MKILDWYILKRYLGTFVMMLFLFIPIGITINIAEKIDKILENEVPFWEVVNYYIDFTVYFANLLFPLFLFLSVIWFTSKLAQNTEIIAFLSSGVSFWRFLRPYLIGSTVVSLGALVMGMYLAPNASKGFNEFKYTYLKRGAEVQETSDVYRQINDKEYIYASHFQPRLNTARNFTLEHFEGNELKFKISASRLKLNEEDSTYTLTNFNKRIIGEEGDELITEISLDTVLPFEFEDLTPVSYMAETLNYQELRDFIAQEKRRGSGNINRYQVVAYKRWSLPVSAYILTVIAVAVSSMKRRGGMGVNLALGITLAFVFIFMDKVFGTIAEQSTFSPLLAVWFPNIFFGILAIYLLWNAKR
ncbi:lipopolysaccharide export system permease protein [Salinimicrobium sediminis]|uniref:Lipopolysaccharide export system permease protein n=1 Tax=Salinimicrobium sediminis TaxID=1343891 RepID=A0A285X194_9FLAO|nr:LptF/LptG family permease [Salinimicrobium sediminis]MDX1752344.1 LptF/LptG family permease [Salinimicrobium sediminis]SOC78504.1 lipopolysaccharide export system permease protein [Salinimicrobium sediminis]